MTIAPTLHTPRLTLRAHRVDDLDALAAMWADPAVFARIGGKARDREEVWLRLLRSIGQWTAFGYGGWVVEVDGRAIGDVGLLEARRAIAPALDVPEMGWALAPAAHGRGYATEAVAAALGWADAQGMARTCCIIDPDNAASIAVAARMAYRAVDTRAYRGAPITLYERMAGTGAVA